MPRPSTSARVTSGSLSPLPPLEDIPILDENAVEDEEDTPDTTPGPPNVSLAGDDDEDVSEALKKLQQALNKRAQRLSGTSSSGTEDPTAASQKKGNIAPASDEED